MTILQPQQNAPGAPGMDARWTSGAKSAVGTAVSSKSNVWFSLGHGIFNEVYYPRVDLPAIRDMGLLVADGQHYFSEEQAATDSAVTWYEPGVPAFALANTSRDGCYRIDKKIVTDPGRNSVLQQTTFRALGKDSYHLYVLLAPHLGNLGNGNTAWVEQRGDRTLLLASREEYVLALACSSGFARASAGYVGVSDGWQDVSQHNQMTWQYGRAENGNVALTGEINLTQSSEFTLALGFGNDADEAISNALASLGDGFEKVQAAYVGEWQTWLEGQNAKRLTPFAKNSLTILRCHQSKKPSGGVIAGLASPWGYAHGDDDPIGYHIVWVRDMVESAGGMIAAGAHDSVRQIIGYLQGTQRVDGHWPQNMWLDGTPFWDGVQMDETALPILLVNLARREEVVTNDDVLDFWPMAKKAAGYIVRNGPVTQQDRWEEDPGYTPFTVSAEIAALLAAADFADLNHETDLAAYLRETADNWHDALDRWLYVRGTDWAKTYDVSGYYERIASVDGSAVARFQNTVNVKNVPSQDALIQAAHLISPDALALVRFGLRDANDPRIADTVRMIDALLKIDTPAGATWHRYNGDGYGEHADGTAFDGTGIGRGWPLLTGERAHYELASGDRESAEKLKTAMEEFACHSGLLPEQVWDGDPIPAHELELGRPSGSAMPLAWAHAEYLKLVRSLQDNQIFDLPPQTVKRYLREKVVSPYRSWRFNHKIRSMQPGKILRIETLAPAKIHWSDNNWQSVHDIETDDTGLGVYVADLATAQLKTGAQVQFSFYWQHAEKWEGNDFSVSVID